MARSSPCAEDPTFRACCCCEIPRRINATYAFPDRQTVLCLCLKCEALGFRLLPSGEIVRELEAAA